MTRHHHPREDLIPDLATPVHETCQILGSRCLSQLLIESPLPGRMATTLNFLRPLSVSPQSSRAFRFIHPILR